MFAVIGSPETVRR